MDRQKTGKITTIFNDVLDTGTIKASVICPLSRRTDCPERLNSWLAPVPMSPYIFLGYRLLFVMVHPNEQRHDLLIDPFGIKIKAILRDGTDQPSFLHVSQEDYY